MLCVYAGVGKGRGAPVYAITPRNQLSTEKHICFGRVFFVILPVGARRLYFTMNNQLRADQVFAILAPNWSNPLLAPGPPKGDSGRSQESPGRVWRSSVRVPGDPTYRKTPDQPHQRPLCCNNNDNASAIRIDLRYPETLISIFKILLSF